MKVAEWAVKRSSCIESGRKHTGIFALVPVMHLYFFLLDLPFRMLLIKDRIGPKGDNVL